MFDRIAWGMVQVSGMLQGMIGNYLYRYAKTPAQKMKMIQISMSGFFLARSEPGDIPKEVGMKVLLQMKMALVLIVGLQIYDIWMKVK